MNEEYTTVKLDIPRLSDFEIKQSVNYGLSITDELNKLIIKDSNERYIRELLNRINKAIFYMENYISVEEYNEPVKCEFGEVIRLLKGDKE